MTDSLNPYELARLADVPSPDGLDSPGAEFLKSVAVAAAEARGWMADEEGDLEDTAHEAADSMVPVYTHERWQVFVDLAAYQESDELAEYVDMGKQVDMTELAGAALYLIARRLVVALLTDEEE